MEAAVNLLKCQLLSVLPQSPALASHFSPEGNLYDLACHDLTSSPLPSQNLCPECWPPCCSSNRRGHSNVHKNKTEIFLSNRNCESISSFASSLTYQSGSIPLWANQMWGCGILICMRAAQLGTRNGEFSLCQSVPLWLGEHFPFQLKSVCPPGAVNTKGTKGERSCLASWGGAEQSKAEWTGAV